LIAFAAIAAIGNAMFALGQRQSAVVGNGMLFVGASAILALLLCLVTAPLVGTMDLAALRSYWRSILLSGIGLFLTYVGFNLLYARFGTSPYVVYASLSILTTTVGIGFLYLREPMNPYRVAAVLLALGAIVLFSLGQSRT
jgi:drug/metabolite transporter (DMT)-like permease